MVKRERLNGWAKISAYILLIVFAWAENKFGLLISDRYILERGEALERREEALEQRITFLEQTLIKLGVEEVVEREMNHAGSDHE